MSGLNQTAGGSAKGYIRKHDFVSNTSYCGFATIGSNENESVWSIAKIVVATDVTNAKNSIETKIDNIVIDNESIANEVWEQQPERLKNVSTVETTGEQIANFNI